MQDAEFLPVTWAALMLGIDRSRVRDLIHRGELVPYDDPLDRRRTLVSVADIARLHQPRPRPRPQGTPAASGRR